MLVDLLGADHHGYIPRLKASIEALGNNPDKLQVDIIQMVRLVENLSLIHIFAPSYCFSILYPTPQTTLI